MKVTLEMLCCPIRSVVSSGFIPSVSCRVIVISLLGPASTDEGGLHLSITLLWAETWSTRVTSSRDFQTTRPPN